jgi:hypothetical protein
VRQTDEVLDKYDTLIIISFDSQRRQAITPAETEALRGFLPAGNHAVRLPAPRHRRHRRQARQPSRSGFMSRSGRGAGLPWG